MKMALGQMSTFRIEHRVNPERPHTALAQSTSTRTGMVCIDVIMYSYVLNLKSLIITVALHLSALTNIEYHYRCIPISVSFTGLYSGNCHGIQARNAVS